MVGVATDTARRIRAEQAMAKYQVGGGVGWGLVMSCTSGLEVLMPPHFSSRLVSSLPAHVTGMLVLGWVTMGWDVHC
jgi:hypothetical protein